MKEAKKIFFLSGSVFTAVSLIMLLSNSLFLAIHENSDHKDERYISVLSDHGSFSNFIRTEDEKCTYCDLLIHSSKFFNLKKNLLPDLSFIICGNIKGFKENFRSVSQTSFKARSPPVQFL